MAHDPAIVLSLVKARLNRLSNDTTLDSYFTMRISAADAELGRMGVCLLPSDTGDAMLLADYVAWQHNNRDQAGSMPDWLRLRIRERWLHHDP